MKFPALLFALLAMFLRRRGLLPSYEVWLRSDEADDITGDGVIDEDDYEEYVAEIDADYLDEEE